MNKEKIIKSSEEFTEIIQKGQCIHNKYFNIYYIKSDNTKYGISIPKKFGSAVLRNKYKRRIKSIIHNNEKSIQNSYNYVIILKKDAIEIDYQNLSMELINNFKKVGANEKKN